MKIVLEVKNKPQKNDILVYNGSEWESIPSHLFLNRLTILEKKFVEEQEKRDKETKDFKEKVNEKLEQHHNVLQMLVKGEK